MRLTTFTKPVIRSKFLLLSFLFSLLGGLASGQTYRAANNAETAAINKAAHIIVPLIDGCANNDWEKLEGGSMAPEYYAVRRDPETVMATQPFDVWHFSIKSGSDYYNKNIKAYYDKLSDGSLDANDSKAMEQATKEGEKINGMINLYVEVMVNGINIPFNPAKREGIDLKIPGCFFAWKQKPDNNFRGANYNTPESYVLAFGSWGNARYADRNYQFTFSHPKGAPVIENVIIVISGSKERIQQLFRSINWNKVNEVLAR
jgi:hypothetical protein